jgi:hypothetical protein
MILRALIIWVVLLFVAILNGAARSAVITPWMGEQAGHIISTLILSLAILVVAWTSIGWINPGSGKDALLVGTAWVILTVAFEFLAGHYLFGNPWEKLFADYDIAQGRIWGLVLITSFIAPLLAMWTKGR